MRSKLSKITIIQICVRTSLHKSCCGCQEGIDKKCCKSLVMRTDAKGLRDNCWVCPETRHGNERTGHPRTIDIYKYMGVSENSAPLNPMVNDHYPF